MPLFELDACSSQGDRYTSALIPVLRELHTSKVRCVSLLFPVIVLKGGILCGNVDSVIV